MGDDVPENLEVLEGEGSWPKFWSAEERPVLAKVVEWGTGLFVWEELLVATLGGDLEEVFQL